MKIDNLKLFVKSVEVFCPCSLHNRSRGRQGTSDRTRPCKGAGCWPGHSVQNLVQILRVQQRRHVLVVRIRIYAPLDGSRQRLEDLSNQVSTRDYSVHYNGCGSVKYARDCKPALARFVDLRCRRRSNRRLYTALRKVTSFLLRSPRHCGCLL